MDPQAFNEMMAQYGGPQGQAPGASPIMSGISANHPAPQGSPQPPAPAQHGNWLTHLLPTAGALGGSVGGAAIGSAILPVFGTAIGGILGAAIGGGGAKAAENGLEGQSVGKDVVNEGLESGVGQAVGGVVGKGLGLGAKALAGRADGIIARDTAQKAIDNRALALSGINANRQGELGANNLLDHVTNMGFDETNPEHVIKLAQSSNDILNSNLDKALADSGTLDLSHYPQIVKDALAKQGGVLDSYDKVALGRGRMSTPNTPAGKLLTRLENLGAGVAKNESDPNEIRTLTTQLGDMAQKYRGSELPEDKATYAVVNDIRNQVKNALYDRPEVNAALKGLPGNVTAEDVGSQQLADHLNNVISNAGANGGTPAQDLLSEISRNINVNDLGNEMAKAHQVGSSTAAQARAAANAGIENANTNQILDAGHQVASAHGPLGTALAFSKHAINNPKILDTLSRYGKLAAKVAPAAGAAVGSANAQLTDNGDTMGGTMMTPTAQQGDITANSTVGGPAGGLTRNDLLTLALYSPSTFNALVTPAAVNQQNVATANTAEQALSSLGQAPGGGILSQLAGHFGIGPTGEYQRKASNVAQQVSAALPGSDQGTIARELTDYNAGPGAINHSIAQLLANLQSVKQNNTNGAYQQLMNYQPSVLSAAGL